MINAVAALPQRVVLILYVVPKDTLDGTRMLAVRDLKMEARQHGAKVKEGFLNSTEELDQYIRDGGDINLVLKEAFGYRLREFHAIWIAGGGCCSFVREIIRLAYTSNPFVPVIDKTHHPDRPASKLIKVWQNYADRLAGANRYDDAVWVG